MTKWQQKFHTGDVMCHYPDLSSASDCNFPFTYDQSEALPRHLNSMKFLQSFLRRHFTGKPVLVLKNVGCSLRLSDGCSVQLMQGCDAAGCSHVGWHRPQCRPKQLLLFLWPYFYADKLSRVEGTFPYKMWWTVYVRNKKFGLAWRVTRPARRESDGIASPSWFCTFLKNATTQDPNIKGGVSRKFPPNLATRTHMYELVTKLGLRRTDNHFYYTLYSLSVARGARGGREEGSLPPRAPRPSRFSRA